MVGRRRCTGKMPPRLHSWPGGAPALASRDVTHDDTTNATSLLPPRGHDQGGTPRRRPQTLIAVCRLTRSASDGGDAVVVPLLGASPHSRTRRRSRASFAAARLFAAFVIAGAVRAATASSAAGRLECQVPRRAPSTKRVVFRCCPAHFFLVARA